MKKSQKKWDYKACKREAQKYKNRKGFYLNAESAYRRALHKGWLDDFFGPPERRAIGYFNDYERCKAEAQQYKDRTAFARGNQSAYRWAIRNGWLDEFFPTKKSKGGGPVKLDYDTCKREAKKYKNRTALSQSNQTVYEACLRNGWLDDFFGSIPERNKRGYFNDYERCKAEAQQYKDRTAFAQGSRTAYRWAMRNDWMTEFFPTKKDRLIHIILGEKKSYTKKHRTSFFYPDSFPLDYVHLKDIERGKRILHQQDFDALFKAMQAVRKKALKLLRKSEDKSISLQELKADAVDLLTREQVKIKLSVLCGEREHSAGKRLCHALKKDSATLNAEHRATLIDRLYLFLRSTKM